MTALLLVALFAAPVCADDVLRLELPKPGGGVVQVATLAPRVVVVDLWATWCKPCVAALPRLDALAAEFASKGVVVVAVSQDEDPALVRRFLAEVPLRHLHVTMDVKHRVAERLKPSTLPTTYVLDAKGTVLATFVGAHADTETRLRAALAAALP